MKRSLCWVAGSGAALMAFALQASDKQNAVEPNHYSTPPGITLVEVSRTGRSAKGVLWHRLGDENGETLFVSGHDVEPGVSACRDECLKEFPPAIAIPGSKPAGDWTLFPREDDRLQWVYQGKPLYRFARETRMNEVLENVLALSKKESVADFVAHEVKKDLLLPPEGWTIARFNPLGGKSIPGTVKVVNLPGVSRMVFADREGKTLYVFRGNRDEIEATCANCANSWQALRAAEMSRPTGDFTPVKHADGSRQWTYRGGLLFTHTGDFMSGDVNGITQDSDPRWQIATVAHHFTPAAATVRDDKMFGRILASVDGLPLYSRYHIRRNFYASRLEDDELYVVGKRLGVQGCDSLCLQTWRPLLAPEDAHASGFWEIVDRGDGTRQWAYKGFVQFTYVNDEPYGAVRGNNQYEYVVGDDGRYKVADVQSTDEPANGLPVGFHWRVSDLYPK